LKDKIKDHKNFDKIQRKKKRNQKKKNQIKISIILIEKIKNLIRGIKLKTIKILTKKKKKS
jgi:hypothetical protein